MYLIIFSAVLVLTIDGLMSHPPPLEMVDMTYSYEEAVFPFPQQPEFKFNLVQNGTVNYGFWVQIDAIYSGTHIGTHMDAPCHFQEGGPCINDIPLNKMIGPVAVIDISDRAAKDRDALMTSQDLMDWENTHGQSLEDKIVLLRTGWGKYWEDKKKYLGTDTDDPSQVHFPGPSSEAAQWIVDNRKIRSLGVDTISIDPGFYYDFKVHRILLPHLVFALENVANMDKLPAYGATLYALPMKISNSSGAAVRLLATFPKKHLH